MGSGKTYRIREDSPTTFEIKDEWDDTQSFDFRGMEKHVNALLRRDPRAILMTDKFTFGPHTGEWPYAILDKRGGVVAGDFSPVDLWIKHGGALLSGRTPRMASLEAGEMDPFNAEFGEFFVQETAMDRILQGRELGDPSTHALQDLTDLHGPKVGLPLPQNAGTRVQFVATLGAVLTYPDVPGEKVAGTVVLVKTAEGNVTSLPDGRVFVSWDDGKFRAIQAEHLALAEPEEGTVKRANCVRRVVADLGDLSSMFVARVGSGDELVHKATKDLWSVSEGDNGFVIERLFNQDGNPLKV